MEWNQPIGRKNMVTEPVELTGEVIRIGAVKTDESYREIDRFNMCIRPKFYKKINKAVEKVTGLANSSITYGIDFLRGYDHFMKWCGKDPLICTWGTEDEKIMRSNLLVHRRKDDFPPYIDLQAIYSHRITKDSKQYGVISVIESYGLECDLPAHDALNDAVYTHRIAREMKAATYFCEYDDILREIEKEREEARQKRYCKVYDGFDTADVIMKTRRIALCRCPECRGKVERSPYKAAGENIYTCTAKCETCGEFDITVTISPAPDGKFSAEKRYTALDRTP